MEAVVETDTVVSLHVGSSGLTPAPPGAGMDALQLGATLFGQLSLIACAEWLWSGYPLRLPTLKIAMSEGGIGWVAMLRDRLENIVDRSRYGLGWDESGRPTCCSATSGSAPLTTRPPSTRAMPSGSTTSWWRSTTRTATAPGPTPRT